MRAFSQAEAESIVRHLYDIAYGAGPGTDLIFTLEKVDGTSAVGILAFLDEKEESFSVVLDEPPGNTHMDVRWDEIVHIGVRWG